MHAAPSLPASPAHSSLTPRSAGAPAASNHAGPAASGGACAAEAAGALIVLAAPPTAPSDLHATPHLPHARTTAPLTSPTPAALPSGSGSGVHASGSQPGPSRGQALSNRAQRELKGLQSFGWDRLVAPAVCCSAQVGLQQLLGCTGHCNHWALRRAQAVREADAALCPITTAH